MIVGEMKVMQHPPEDREKKTIASRVSHEIRQAILRGDMKPGSKINLDRLRTGYDISLSPCAKACRAWSRTGWSNWRTYAATGLLRVHKQPRRSDPPSRRVQIARSQTLHRTGRSRMGERRHARALPPQSYRARSLRPTSLEAWEEAHHDFHRRLIQGCGMPLLLRFCSVLHNLNDRYRRIFLATIRATATSGANTARLLRRPWHDDHQRPARPCAVTSTEPAPTSRGPRCGSQRRLAS